MKKISLIFLAFAFLFACKSSTKEIEGKTNTNSSGKAKFEFVDEVHDFGNITQGERVEYNFKFKNVGDADLVIKTAKASCGCTSPEYKKDPIKPGEEGNISVTFDSSNREGNQYKTITVTANTDPDVHELVITCNVVKP